jgi:hypothetical protein
MKGSCEDVELLVTPQLEKDFVGFVGVQACKDRKNKLKLYNKATFYTNLFAFWLTGTRNMADFAGNCAERLWWCWWFSAGFAESYVSALFLIKILCHFVYLLWKLIATQLKRIDVLFQAEDKILLDLVKNNKKSCKPFNQLFVIRCLNHQPMLLDF